MSAIADGLRNTPSYELQEEGAGLVVVRDWYMTGWTDVVVDMLTEVNDNLGLLWSFSTGEHGPKYTIAPSLRVGFIAQRELGASSFVSVSAASVLFGEFTELPCTADYGDIGGGVQQVNCRLAASPMPPEETLTYLVKQTPTRFRIGLQLTGRF